MQFITRHDMDHAWDFLSAFRSFLENNCRTGHLSKEAKNQSIAIDFLMSADGIVQELVHVLPKEIKLSQAGYAYHHTAWYYQERNDTEEHQNN